MSEYQAGPTLNRAIAERVFGHAILDVADIVVEAERYFLVGGGQLPEYSTDYGEALTVFEAMVERVGWGALTVDMEDTRGQGLVYWCRFGSGAEHSGPLPLAVCRAALASVEEQ